MASDSGGDLQHPRRNLGNRFRSQAEKFVKLSRADPERMKENFDLKGFIIDQQDMNSLDAMDRGNGVAWRSGDPCNSA